MYKTISKIYFFVISLLFLCFSLAGCSSLLHGEEFKSTKGKDFSKRFNKPVVAGTIKSPEISESSGLTSSRCNNGVLWTHNDSRNGAFIFALNEKGKKLGTWKISGATNVDWEDIAAVKEDDGKCFLYIGDIGNNARNRSEMTIYKVAEPSVSAEAKPSVNEKPRSTQKARPIKFKYPDFRHNAEALLVNPKTREVYIITKRISGAAGVYKLAEERQKNNYVLKKVSDLSLPALPNGLLTAGEISEDGKRVVVCDYYNAYEITLPEKAKKFDEIWKEEPSIIELGKREQGEAICYSVDMTSIFATSEKRNSPLIKVTRK